MPPKTLVLAFLVFIPGLALSLDECSQEFSPVCGADGKTYWNQCILESLEIQEDYSGVCGNNACPLEYSPVCGEDNKAYVNECFMQREGVVLAYEGLCTGYCPSICFEVGAFRERICSTQGITYPNQCLLECFKAEPMFLGYCLTGYSCGDAKCMHSPSVNISGAPESEYLACEQDCGAASYTMDSVITDGSTVQSPFTLSLSDLNPGPFNSYEIKASFFVCFDELSPGKECENRALVCEDSFFDREFSCEYTLLPGQYDLFVELFHPFFSKPVTGWDKDNGRWVDDLTVSLVEEVPPSREPESPETGLSALLDKLLKRFLPARLSGLLLSSAFYGYSWLYLFVVLLGAAAGYVAYRKSFVIAPERIEKKAIKMAKHAGRITAGLAVFFVPIAFSSALHEGIGFAVALVELALIPLLVLFYKRYAEKREITRFFVR